MMRKTLTPIALGFAAVFTLGACGGGDVDTMDTGMGMGDPMAAPAPAPAPAPMSDSMPMDTGAMADTTMDTTRTDTSTLPPPR